MDCKQINILTNRRFHGVDVTDYTMRMDYMCEDERCTVILVDLKNERIAVQNETDDIIHRAFGIKAKPTWEDLQWIKITYLAPTAR